MAGKVDGVSGAGGQNNRTHKNGKMPGKVDGVSGAWGVGQTNRTHKNRKNGKKNWTVCLVRGDKATELIKMEKWREKWTVCLAPG